MLIRNSAEETVIGGRRSAVQAVIKKLESPFVDLPTVSTVHCEIGRTVRAVYHSLHDLETTAPQGIDFYSGAWGRSYSVDRESAADAITAQAIAPIDFPAVIERAYADGIGVFVEVGPGSSCTRLIGQILSGRPHLAFSACRPDRDAAVALLEVLAGLISHRAAVDLSRLYGQPTEDRHATNREAEHGEARRHTIRVDVRGRAFQVPTLPSRRTAPRHGWHVKGRRSQGNSTSAQHSARSLAARCPCTIPGGRASRRAMAQSGSDGASPSRNHARRFGTDGSRRRTRNRVSAPSFPAGGAWRQ